MDASGDYMVLNVLGSVIERGHYTNGARMGSSWPAGIYFVDTYNSPIIGIRSGNTNINLSQNLFSSSNLTNLPFPTATSSKPVINALTIKPNGRLLRFGIQDAEIYLSEGLAFDTKAPSRVLDLVWKDNPVLRAIAVNPYTSLSRTIDFTQMAP